MKSIISMLLSTLFLSTLTSLLAVNVYSHAPELHKKEGAEKPQCAALEKMDRSKIDAKDPVMQAIMIQCKDWLHDNPDSHKNIDSNNNLHHKSSDYVPSHHK